MEESSDPLSAVVIGGVDPDDADKTYNVPQFRSYLTRWQLGQLLTGLLQHGQEGQVGLGLQRAILHTHIHIHRGKQSRGSEQRDTLYDLLCDFLYLHLLCHVAEALCIERLGELQDGLNVLDLWVFQLLTDTQ